MLGYLTLSSSQTAGRSCEKGYRSWDSQFFKTHVTPKGWDVKGAIPQNACWRLGCGEACKRWSTIGPSQKPQPFKGVREKCNEIALSMCTAQCGSMEAKALSFVLRAASSEHYQSSTRRVFTYVVGGRVGMNDTCYFTLDMKKLDPRPHPVPPHDRKDVSPVPTLNPPLSQPQNLNCWLSYLKP